MILIDKYDKIGKEVFTIELEKFIGNEKSEYLNNILDTNGSNEKILEDLYNLNIENEYFIEGLKELKKVKLMLEILGVNDDEFKINLKIIRGLDYYTGTVFETTLVGNESYGSICSGGRYDNLAEKYTDNILPGVGISIGLTRLFFVLKEIGFIDRYNIENNIDYLILPIGDTIEYCGEVLKSLGEKGYKSSIYFEEESLKKKMSYANKLGVSNVILIGEDEIKKKRVKIKNMNSGDIISIDYKLI